MEVKPKYVKAIHIAEITGIKKASILRLAGCHLIPALRIGSIIRFDEIKVLKCLEERYFTNYISMDETPVLKDNLYKEATFIYTNARRIADLLSTSIASVIKLANEDQIPALKIGGAWRFNESEVIEYIEKVFSNYYDSTSGYTHKINDRRFLHNRQRKSNT
ncbi:helix-turn-helix domain-containing protein [Pelosinus propionicus]|uniref:DNA binding domain-containing protein, excisionase family n=1 Tax=Pelosinus propionicus DSM 13327 TaxID=1123291 RepID=A0A1I4JI89_9FIRM|nr:helix-turn-helix domain-containing protein [Pelosinus propionicus]SFL65903.1 DNA binding domain-containing protein, excisionase family [Pelosinus propionicus DSM 13327]